MKSAPSKRPVSTAHSPSHWSSVFPCAWTIDMTFACVITESLGAALSAAFCNRWLKVSRSTAMPLATTNWSTASFFCPWA